MLYTGRNVSINGVYLEPSDRSWVFESRSNYNPVGISEARLDVNAVLEVVDTEKNIHLISRLISLFRQNLPVEITENVHEEDIVNGSFIIKDIETDTNGSNVKFRFEFIQISSSFGVEETSKRIVDAFMKDRGTTLTKEDAAYLLVGVLLGDFNKI